MGVIKILLAAFLIAGIVSAVWLFLELEKEPERPDIIYKWWGPGKSDKEDEKFPRKYSIDVPEKELVDLKDRLAKTRFSKGLEGINFEYGMNHEYLQKFVEYWLTKYDWRKAEKKLNNFPQYLIRISGIDVHYLHAKPANFKNKRVVPILISHGWPGSIVEFQNTIPKLVEPREDQDFVFEVICPHIPGYGFSEAPHKPGHNVMDTALMYAKLMAILGHDRFYVQGGDWGSGVVTALSILFPERIIGMHLNMAPYEGSPKNILMWLLGGMFPSLAPAAEIGSPGIYPIDTFLSKTISLSGYFHLQATFPDSIGAAFIDSPAGLAAYFLDKFAYGTDVNNPEEGLSRLEKDELITNMMVYWFSKSITSSLRYYKEALKPDFLKLKLLRKSTSVPTGFLLCEREPLMSSTSLGWNRYKNITYWHKTENCGHFAAMEYPGGFSDQIWKFVSKIEMI